MLYSNSNDNDNKFDPQGQQHKITFLMKQRSTAATSHISPAIFTAPILPAAAAPPKDASSFSAMDNYFESRDEVEAILDERTAASKIFSCMIPKTRDFGYEDQEQQQQQQIVRHKQKKKLLRGASVIAQQRHKNVASATLPSPLDTRIPEREENVETLLDEKRKSKIAHKLTNKQHSDHGQQSVHHQQKKKSLRRMTRHQDHSVASTVASSVDDGETESRQGKLSRILAKKRTDQQLARCKVKKNPQTERCNEGREEEVEIVLDHATKSKFFHKSSRKRDGRHQQNVIRHKPEKQTEQQGQQVIHEYSIFPDETDSFREFPSSTCASLSWKW